ncbi:MAG TPA: hypothetical protein VLV87_01375 [Gammaproteobacteria bacterium]|nr:hypothetical protein [Gammaproteobacteria bacterium]
MVVATQAEPAAEADFLGKPPPFFSFAYHLGFLPRVIAYRIQDYRRRHGQPRTGFGPDTQLESPLVIAACILLMVFGLPSAIETGSVGGWISTFVGAGGLAALIGWSIVNEWRWRRAEGHRYGYADFMPSVFFFCLLAGGSAGLIVGGVATNDPMSGYAWTLPGLLAGYLGGLFAARWVHALGFIKIWFIYVAVLGLVLLPFEDLMVLYIYSIKR